MPRRLLPLLDGTRPVDAITAALHEWTPPEILSALGMLAERGLIADRLVDSAASSPEARAQAAFYAAASTGPANRGEIARKALAGARMRLIGSGSVLLELERALRTCGAEGLTVSAWDSPPTPEALRQQLDHGSDLVLLALPRPLPAVLSVANELCLSQGVPLLPVVIDGGEAVIGPTVLPGRSACYECYKQRLLTNAASPDDDAAYLAYLDQSAEGAPLAEWPPFTIAVAATAAMEAVRIITQFMPAATAGQVLFIDGFGGAQRASRVWKIPGCPACAKARYVPSGGGPDGH
jgi:bacteriocin biosynthesis cyclodehydratase domain-containing protein